MGSRSPGLGFLVLFVLASGVEAQSHRLSESLSRARGEYVSAAEVSPDGALVVFSTANHPDAGLYSAPIKGGAPVRLAEPPSDFLVSPDGSRVVYRRRDLYSVPIRGGRSLRLNVPVPDDSVGEYAFSADGRWVVYAFDGIHRAPADGSSAALRLTESGTDLRISPDAAFVVYRDSSALGALQLFSVRLDGSGPPRRLNPALVAGGRVESNFSISADSRHVLYVADQVLDEQFQLYAVPIDGSASAVDLSGPPLNAFQDVTAGQISLDGTRVVFRADREVARRVELYSVPIDRSAEPVRLNHDLRQLDDVTTFDLSPDGRWVVFGVSERATLFQLHAVPLDGSAPAHPLFAPLAPEGEIERFRIDPTGRRVVYAADAEGDGVLSLFSAPLVHPDDPVELHGAGLGPSYQLLFEVVPGGERVVFRARDGIRMDLLGVPIDGSSPAALLTGSPVDGESLYHQIRSSPDGSRVVVRAQESWDGELSVFSVPTDASAAPVRLNAPLALGESQGDVRAFRIAPGGERLLFHSDAPSEDVTDDEIYSVLADGSRPPMRIHPSFTARTDDAALSRISADGTWAVFGCGWDESEDPLALFSTPVDGSAEPVFLGYGSHAISPRSDVVVIAHDYWDDPFRLLARPLDGSGSELDLSGVVHTPPRELSLTPDGSLVLYACAQFAAGVHELLSVPVDGSAAPSRLNGALVAGGDVHDFRLAPSGTSTVYLADQGTDDVIELHTVPVQPGGAPLVLSGPMVAGGDAWPDARRGLLISADSTRVLYVADQDADEVHELYGAPLDGSSAAVRLSGPMVAGGDVLAPFLDRDTSPRIPMIRIAPDARLAVYLADQDEDERFELYGVPLDGSAPAVKLSAGAHVATFGSYENDGPSFEIAPDSSVVVYRARNTPDESFQLFAAPLDGSRLPLRLNPELVAGGEVEPFFRISPNGRHVAYVADQRTDEVRELFAVPLAGGASERLSGPLVAQGDVLAHAVQFHPDSARVYYIANQDSADTFELYLTFVGRARREAPPPPGASDGVRLK